MTRNDPVLNPTDDPCRVRRDVNGRPANPGDTYPKKNRLWIEDSASGYHDNQWKAREGFSVSIPKSTWADSNAPIFGVRWCPHQGLGGGVEYRISRSVSLRSGGDYQHAYFFNPSYAIQGQHDFRAVCSVVLSV
jgi:hypothetical protein